MRGVAYPLLLRPALLQHHIYVHETSLPPLISSLPRPMTLQSHESSSRTATHVLEGFLLHLNTYFGMLR